MDPSLLHRPGARRFATLLLGICLMAACRGGREVRMNDAGTPQRPIAEVLAEWSPRWIALPGVTAVGQGALPSGAPCIRVYLRVRDAGLERRIPRQVEGYRVVFQVSGEIRALPDAGR
jgi:hypothetical protein